MRDCIFDVKLVSRIYAFRILHAVLDAYFHFVNIYLSMSPMHHPVHGYVRLPAFKAAYRTACLVSFASVSPSIFNYLWFDVCIHLYSSRHIVECARAICLDI